MLHFKLLCPFCNFRFMDSMSADSDKEETEDSFRDFEGKKSAVVTAVCIILNGIETMKRYGTCESNLYKMTII